MNRSTTTALWAVALLFFAGVLAACGPLGGTCGELPTIEVPSGTFAFSTSYGTDSDIALAEVMDGTLVIDPDIEVATLTYTDSDGLETTVSFAIGEVQQGF